MSEIMTVVEHLTLPKEHSLKQRADASRAETQVDFSTFSSHEALEAWKYPRTVIMLAEKALQMTDPDDIATVAEETNDADVLTLRTA